MVVDLNGTYTHGSSRIKKIAGLQGEEAADIRNDFVHPEKHVTRPSLLHRLTIDIEVEVQVLNVEL